MTSPPDDRIPLVCIDCDRPFMALGQWQTRCRRCYATFKAGKAETAATDLATLTARC